jgi:Ca2+-transporting ATPase
MDKKEFFWHAFTLKEVEDELNTDLSDGLAESEVKERHRLFGLNVLPEEKPRSLFSLFWGQFENPLIYILVIAGIITLFLRDYADSIVIGITVFLNVIIGFFQENKASNILNELKKIIKIKTYTIREGKKKELDQSELVQGDIFLLRPGQKVPADGRLIESFHLKVNESPLTGEWLPAEKQSKILPKETLLADRDNMVYMSCLIEEGQGRAVTVATGKNTEIGKIAVLVGETQEEETIYQKRIKRLSKVAGLLISVASLLIFFLGIARGIDLFQMFTTAVAMAVGAIPEGLPVAITVILALGMQRILKKKGLIRKMTVAETLGSTSVICTDKTGTLTEGKMQVAGIFTGQKELLSDGNHYSEEINKDGIESHILALKISLLCSDAFIENPDEPLEKWIIRGRPTEKALLLAGLQAGLNKKDFDKTEPRIEEKFFDPVSKYSASLRELSAGQHILYMVGAPEIILNMSKFLDVDGREGILSPEKIRELTEKFEILAAKGQRVLATAYRKIKYPKILDLEKCLDNLTFVGFIALHDPIRKEVKEAVKKCREAGMRTIIITGDHKMTAKAIALELDLKADEKNIIEGRGLDKLSDEELKKRIKDIEIYARIEPKQKLRIVKIWQEIGEVAAMTGDGINDAPALKKADIGIALGSGTDVAKEASDLVLLTDNFSIIVAAVEEGRAIVDNIRKTITILLSGSFSEIILVGASVIAGLPLPILPAQILWENLIEGGPQGIALAFEPKEPDIMGRKPEHPKSPLLTRQMKTIIFGFGIVTDFILLGLFLWLFKKDFSMEKIRTIVFAALAIDTLFYAFSCKNLRKNIWQYNPFSNKYLVASIAFSLMMLFGAIYLPFLQDLLKTQPLNMHGWILLSGLGMINLILIEAIKRYFIIKIRRDNNHNNRVK